MPMEYHEKAQSVFAKDMTLITKPEDNNSFLSDLTTSGNADAEKPITCGFYRQLVGPPLVYTYTYHEMKVIVEGEFHISDQTGKKAIGLPGDVFYFQKGDTITFSSPADGPGYGLGFFSGQKAWGVI